jgi:hypothetical protein
MKCNADDVLISIALSSTIQYNDYGGLILSDELWGIVKNSPQLLKILTCVETSSDV